MHHLELSLRTPNLIPLAQQAYQMIFESIASLEYEPGQLLSENTLAHELGMSRSPIRQALKMLEQEGLVTTLPQRGTLISKLDEKEAHDAVVVRRLLEEWALDEMRGGGVRPDIQRLSDLLQAQERACAAGEYGLFLELDTAFHEEILAATGNGKAREVLRQLNICLLRLRTWTIRRNKSLHESVREHRAIFQAIIDSDWDRATALILAAGDELMRAIGDMKREKPAYFND
jgi:DNA-binding GntR family transcriptional regulator